MSDILARIRVRETHGIRRFLYPLSTLLRLPDGEDVAGLGLVDQDSSGVPAQITSDSSGLYRLDFAVSLAPHETRELTLSQGVNSPIVADPLQVTGDGGIQSRQQKFAIDLGRDGSILQVIYDGVTHLSGPCLITVNGEEAAMENEHPWTAAYAAGLSLNARMEASVSYSHCSALNRTEITACKSWALVEQELWYAREGDVISFHLPLAITSSTLLYDFGVGNSIYGKLQQGAINTAVWEMTLGTPYQWSLKVDGRTDYIGKVADWSELRRQTWFHLIDEDKALAVAITNLPAECETVTVTLNLNGQVTVAFRLGKKTRDNYLFGVCYHFLNDVPAIAAATNPQSILLPPTVEVLPA